MFVFFYTAHIHAYNKKSHEHVQTLYLDFVGKIIPGRMIVTSLSDKVADIGNLQIWKKIVERKENVEHCRCFWCSKKSILYECRAGPNSSSFHITQAWVCFFIVCKVIVCN